MRDPRIEPVSAELERLLAAERELQPAPAEFKARALDRARAALLSKSALPAPRPLRSRRTWLLAAAAAIAFAAVAFAALRGLGPKDGASNQAPPIDQSSQRPQPAAAPREPTVETAPGETASPTELPAPKKSEREATPRRSSSADPHTLELGVLQRARAAVASGQFTTALEAIAEHQRRFPAGVLQEEREALRVKALAGLGKAEEARQAARRFGEKFPNSVLSPRLEEATKKAP